MVSGKDGDKGAGIESVEVDEDGKLIITLTDGTTLEAIELPKVEVEKCDHEVEKWIPVEVDIDDDDLTCADMLFYGKCTLCEEAVMQVGKECVFEDESHLDPTCVSAGYDRKRCTTCRSITETNIIEALGHDEQDIVFAPTCLKRGYTQHGCTRCGNNRSIDAYVDALGHDIANGKCTRCDKRESTGLAFALVNDTYTLISVNTCADTDIIIPKTYNCVAVTAIGDSAFSSCNNLTSVVFEDTSNWYYTSSYENWINKTGGTKVEESSMALTQVIKDWYSYYLYKL